MYKINAAHHQDLYSNKARMKSVYIFIVMMCCIYCSAQKKNGLIPSQINLPNGWSLTPVGKSLPLGDLPLNIAVSSSKKYIAITNNGQSTQSIQLIDAVNDKILSTVEIPQ